VRMATPQLDGLGSKPCYPCLFSFPLGSSTKTRPFPTQGHGSNRLWYLHKTTPATLESTVSLEG
jgi:hypothetical protein